MKRKRRLTHQSRIRLLAFLCGVPGLITTLLLLGIGQYDLRAYLTAIVLAGGAWLYFAVRLQDTMINPLLTASNMLSALREGDFSLQAGYIHDRDPLGQLMLEINQLTEVLAEHRLGEMEANALLDKIIEEIDAGVLTFDPERRIKLANRAALRMLGLKREQIRDHFAGELDLDKILDCEPDSVIPHPIADLPGRFTVRKGSYRANGQPHQLIILIDVSKNLREEELLAWKRLIRVLGHELNNSMAPIHSLAHSLQKVAKREHLDSDDKEDLVSGLEIIRQRAEGLNRFVSEYTQLARLPKPQRAVVELLPIVTRIHSLFPDGPIELSPACHPATVFADAGQLEQALLNLIKNAVEAAAETNGSVQISCKSDSEWIHLIIDDSGPGIANPDNLFIPFFSTKQGGSGIGLTLSRQIIEAHNGSLSLVNRDDTTGCRATITLPRPHGLPTEGGFSNPPLPRATITLPRPHGIVPIPEHPSSQIRDDLRPLS